MTACEVRVELLVWHPADPAAPLDVSRSWPRVLQVARAGAAGPPGVIVRPGEPVRTAAGRVATALGLRPPLQPRLLAVDQRPDEGGACPEQLALIMDGGWLGTGGGGLVPCDCGDHELVWTPIADLGRVALVHALRVAVTGQPPPLLWRGTSGAAGTS
ncbi:hypothetical protein [Streptomyces buecherae]|uniref:hypothetical protein n=1 Tax=Streptomyces buecherae TaxID=2763006 RepID=UPI001C273427|nr:hypothetical protein [Streptomyces buecherae]